MIIIRQKTAQMKKDNRPGPSKIQTRGDFNAKRAFDILKVKLNFPSISLATRAY
jgi:hypothetical protein